ncbi:hypothetical protein BH10BAC1_BH10BAC1_20590 [soil metagenome]
MTCNDVKQCPRSGSGFAGISCFFDSTAANIDKWREYIEVGLTDTLISEKKYCVRFYVNRANNSGWPVKQIQLVLTNDSLLYNDPNYSYILGVSPILEADSIITDTLNWTKIETVYTAVGGERFVSIGNFSPGNLVNYSIGWPYGAAFNSLGYYYFDDISIYQQPDIFAGNDTIIPPGDSTQLGTIGRPDITYSWSPTAGLNNPNIANPMTTPSSSISYTLTVTDTNQLACTSVFTDTVLVQVGFIGVEELTNGFLVQAYPNPFSESITFKTERADFYEVRIFDVVGKLLFEDSFEGNEHLIHNNVLSSGIYFYEIRNKTKNLYRGKIIKE